MPRRIDKLTDEQRAQMEPWARKWIAEGLRTDPCDRGKFEAAARECYGFAGLKTDVPIIWVPSPMVGAFASSIAAYLIALIRGQKPPKAAVGSAVRSAVDSAVSFAVDSAVDFAVGFAVDSESNAEVRRVMIERFGPERYMRESGAVEVHRDWAGILWRKDVADDEPIVMVEVENSTPEPTGEFKKYWLRVPPNMVRAKQAVAWTFDIPEDQYEPHNYNPETGELLLAQS